MSAIFQARSRPRLEIKNDNKCWSEFKILIAFADDFVFLRIVYFKENWAANFIFFFPFPLTKREYNLHTFGKFLITVKKDLNYWILSYLFFPSPSPIFPGISSYQNDFFLGEGGGAGLCNESKILFYFFLLLQGEKKNKNINKKQRKNSDKLNDIKEMASIYIRYVGNIYFNWFYGFEFGGRGERGPISISYSCTRSELMESTISVRNSGL